MLISLVSRLPIKYSRSSCYLTVTLVLISLWLFMIVSLALLKHSQCLGVNGAAGTLLVWIFFVFLLFLAGTAILMSRWKCLLLRHLWLRLLYVFPFLAVTRKFSPSTVLLSMSSVTQLFHQVRDSANGHSFYFLRLCWYRKDTVHAFYWWQELTVWMLPLRLQITWSEGKKEFETKETKRLVSLILPAKSFFVFPLLICLNLH